MKYGTVRIRQTVNYNRNNLLKLMRDNYFNCFVLYTFESPVQILECAMLNGKKSHAWLRKYTEESVNIQKKFCI